MISQVEVGEFQGYPVNYSKETDVLSCKNVNVFFSQIEKFVSEEAIRAKLGENLYIVKKAKTYVLGC